MLGVTIRLGAAHNSVTTDDGTVFDRSRMTGVERRKLTRLVVQLYERHQKLTARRRKNG